MSCQFKSGKMETLSGCRLQPEYGLCAFTCAHVLLKHNELQELRKDSRKVWRCNEKPVHQQVSGDAVRNYSEQVKQDSTYSGCLIQDEVEKITSCQVFEDKNSETLGLADSVHSSQNEVDEDEIRNERHFFSKPSQKKPSDDGNDVEAFSSDKVHVDRKRLNELWAEGRENKEKRAEIFEICNNICSYILEKHSENVLSVWPAYKPHDNNRIVFVLNTKGSIGDTELGVEYSTVVRPIKTYSDEATIVTESEENKEHSLSFQESESITQTINNNAKELMRCHKNLSVITGSGVRSKNFNQGKHEISRQACIVLYVNCKGLIPLKESSFPKDLDGIPVDVREGEFLTCAPAKEYQPTLQMGCQIESVKTGTLGGFVDHQEYELCAITCAHVVLNDEELHLYRNDSRQAFSGNKRPVYQPDSGDTARNCCGQVKQIIYKSGSANSSGVDLAILQIERRAPDRGKFPDVNNTPTDMVFETGKLCLSVNENFSHVIKFGCATNKTEGFLQFSKCVVKPLLYDRRYQYNSEDYTFPMFNQYEVQPIQQKFVQPGDSGSLVFRKDVSGDLLCIGMVMGVIEPSGSGIVIPISAIKSELGVSEFKNFSWNIMRSIDLRLENIENKFKHS